MFEKTRDLMDEYLKAKQKGDGVPLSTRWPIDAADARVVGQMGFGPSERIAEPVNFSQDN